MLRNFNLNVRYAKSLFDINRVKLIGPASHMQSTWKSVKRKQLIWCLECNATYNICESGSCFGHFLVALTDCSMSKLLENPIRESKLYVVERRSLRPSNSDAI